MELEALAQTVDRFKELGATLAMISPQLPEHNLAIKTEKNLAVPILSDPGNQAAQRYGIRFALPPDLKQVYQQFGIDLPKHNGDESWTLPLPTRLIIDPDGLIRYAEINPDYTIRPDPAETLDALADIKRQ